jgi:hypothetical protein
MGRSLAIAACLAALSCGGCLMNGTRNITLGRGTPSKGEAVVVVGIRNETGRAAFGFRFDQYSLEQRKLTMNCFIDNHVQPGADKIGQGETRYFAFTVPAGDYMGYSQVLGSNGEAGRKAWRADLGEASYFGTFVGAPDTVSLEHRMAEAQAFADKRGLGKLTPAEIAPIEFPPAFVVCTP